MKKLKVILTIVWMSIFTSMVAQNADLKLVDWRPVSRLKVKETEIIKPRFPVIDIHNHLHRLQEAGKYLEEMDKAGVLVCVSLDGASKNDFYKTHVESSRKDAGDRIIVFFYPDFEQIDLPDFGKKEAAKLEQAVKMGCRGLKIYKELGLVHKDKSGKLIAVDDPRLDPIWAKCGELGIPVLIHVSDPVAFFTPTDKYNERYDELGDHPDWNFSDTAKYPTKEKLLQQRNNIIARHPNTIFIGAHIATLPEDLGRVAMWLDQYPNLYVDISARISDIGRQPFTARKFLIKYQDRVLFGLDSAPRAESYRRYYRFLETDDEYFPPNEEGTIQGRWMIYGVNLPDEALEKIYNRNAMKIFSLYKGGSNDWAHVGMGGGGAMFGPMVSPHDPDVTFVSCDMGGSFMTHNGGESWRMFNLSSMVKFFVFDAVDPSVVYANSIALFKSTDLGTTWSLLYPKPADILGVVSKGDHAGEQIVTKDSQHKRVQALAVDPKQSNKLYAAISIEQAVGLYISNDGGESWNKERDFVYNIQNIFIDPSSPDDNRTLYVTSQKGVEKKENGAWINHHVSEPELTFNFFTGGYDKATGKYIIYAISGHSYYNAAQTPPGIFYSENAGKTWENRQNGMMKHAMPSSGIPEWRTIGTSAQNPGTVYLSYNGLQVHPDTTCIGVAKSEDFGKTWTLTWRDMLTKGGNIASPNVGEDWLNERFGPTWGENPFSIGVSPTNPDICYCSDFGRTIKTGNGGKTWEAVYTKRKPGGGWITRGLEVTTGYNVVFDPFDRNHVFLALTDVGLMESFDGGESWSSGTRDNGVPGAWINSTYWMAFDPEVKGRGWAVMSQSHDLPRPKMFRKTGISTYKGGVLITNDAGKTWKPTSEQIGETAATHILFDPTSSIDSRTLYVCAFGKGVYKSTDGGKSWTQKNKGLESKEPFAWRIERRETDGMLFLVVSRRSEDGSIGNAGDGALYKSSDGAENWVKMTLPKGCNAPTFLLVDPKNPKKLILSAWGKVNPGKFAPDTGGGIFVSEDEGNTWVHTMAYDQHIHDLTYDPRTDRYYACGFNASAYYSEDGAKTWTRMKGFNFKWGKRVEPDPRDPGKVFIITFGGGTWHGQAKGDPDAIEDMITPLKRL
jgi:predicted TIM-barrel fold metal-dependent hydrolase/photosystem II stability/assembly factor-like uncharacterized protein